MPQRSKQTRLLEARFSLIDSAPESLGKKMPGVQDDFVKEIRALLNLLHIENGHFVYDDNTAPVLNRIERAIREHINKSKYTSAVTNYLSDFKEIDRANLEYYKAASNINIAKVGLGPLRKQAVDQVTYSLLSEGMDAAFTNPVKEIIRGGAISGQSVVEAQVKLRQFIKGVPGDKLGFFERYVPQIAHDAIGQYDGVIQTRVKDEFEFNAWSYEGSLIVDSRPQCRRWVGMGVVKDAQLPGEIEWALRNGSGMIPATTPETFGIYRGGYRCRHHATAVLV